MKTAKITYVFVNALMHYAEVHVKGSIRFLEDRTDALFAELQSMCPPGAFTVPAKSQWRHYMDCDGRTSDAFEIRLELHHGEKEVRMALRQLEFPVARNRSKK